MYQIACKPKPAFHQQSTCGTGSHNMRFASSPLPAHATQMYPSRTTSMIKGVIRFPWLARAPCSPAARLPVTRQRARQCHIKQRHCCEMFQQPSSSTEVTSVVTKLGSSGNYDPEAKGFTQLHFPQNLPDCKAREVLTCLIQNILNPKAQKRNSTNNSSQGTIS